MVKQTPNIATSTRPVGPEVLISGASFAGLATAYWLDKLGYRVTLIEVASGLRKGGTPVDIEGETIGILARMGMIDAVRAAALPPHRFEFKDADDGTIGVFGGQLGPDDARDEKCEIHRDDLLDILFASIDGKVPLPTGPLPPPSPRFATWQADRRARRLSAITGDFG